MSRRKEGSTCKINSQMNLKIKITRCARTYFAQAHYVRQRILLSFPNYILERNCIRSCVSICIVKLNLTITYVPKFNLGTIHERVNIKHQITNSKVANRWQNLLGFCQLMILLVYILCIKLINRFLLQSPI
jgi:hypothetical protein